MPSTRHRGTRKNAMVHSTPALLAKGASGAGAVISGRGHQAAASTPRFFAHCRTQHQLHAAPKSPGARPASFARAIASTTVAKARAVPPWSRLEAA